MESIQIYLNEPVTGAVVGVPVMFDNPQRKSLEEAASLADLPIIEFVVEPNAAAMAYGLHLHSDMKTILVFDFGGGMLVFVIWLYTE